MNVETTRVHLYSRAFTLIELLVVIAIIAVLASVVLTSLSTARGKANDAQIKTDVNTVFTQANVYFDTNGNYGGTGTTTVTVRGSPCGSTGLFADPTIAAATEQATLVSGSATLHGVPNSYMVCYDEYTGWEMVVPLASDPTQSVCTNNYGITALIPTALAATTFWGVQC